MSRPTVDQPVAQLLDAFAGATPDDLDAEYERLVGALWEEGALTDRAAAATPDLVAALDRVGAGRQGHVLVLLGLLAQAEYPATDGPVATAVRAGLDGYLDLLGRAPTREPLALALLYLLSHLSEDRDRILAAVADLGLEPEERTRLERTVTPLDPADAVLGRVWPSPYEWSLNESEREYDRRWISSLSPEQLASAWQADTTMVRAYMGAKAWWAVRHGTPTVVADASAHREAVEAGAEEIARDVFSRHADAFRCPTCRGRLEFTVDGARCVGCSTAFPLAHGVLDLSAGVADVPDEEDVLQNAAAMKSIGPYYERVLRPAFLRVMGSNWGGEVTPVDEDRYLAEHTAPTDGPVLDLAAGAGRWTAVVAGAVGAGRLVAIDMLTPMMICLRERLPEVAAVRAGALALPFGDATLGAVNCWNALQALPDAAAAIAEVGRCLRPGGTFTVLTFRFGSDPIYRHFQSSHSFPGHPHGIPLFEFDEIRKWLDDAGMVVREESGPGTFVFVTAERTA